MKIDSVPNPSGAGGHISPARVKSGEEKMCAVLAAPVSSAILVRCGQRTMTLKPRDLEKYTGIRGRRGSLLPRGWRKVDGLAVAT